MALKSDLSRPAPLLGHEHAREILARAVALEQPAHAYVFSGPESVGKRTVAVWLASLLNCQAASDSLFGDLPTERPCGACLSCHKMAVGTHPDLVELTVPEKRTRIGVEQVRMLQERAAFGATEGRWKVFLIAEAQRMTDQAANCLLKSLEEPRPGQVFVLCTPSHTALLPTVLSRCQIVRFSTVERERVESWLVGLGTEADRARKASIVAGGRPGAARRLAQDRNAWDFREKVLATAEALARADTLDAMQAAEDLEPLKGTPEEKRAVHERNLELLTAWFRDLICLRNGLDPSVLTNRDQEEALRDSLQRYSAARLYDAVDALQDARLQLARYMNTKLVYARLMLHLRADR